MFATRMDREIEVRQQRGVQLRVERTEKREESDDIARRLIRAYRRDESEHDRSTDLFKIATHDER